MAKETKGEYKEFRTLLRCGIGTKTQKAFAEEIDISKEHLNRLLNNREISRPSIGLLKKMAAHMQTITERMLLESCGYEIEPIEERAKRCEKQIAQGLQTLISMDHSRPWKSIEDALQTIELLHIEENGKLNLNNEENCTEGHHWAEKKLHFTYRWDDGENSCITGADVFYSRTENGNIIFLDSNVEKTKIQSKIAWEMKERLLYAIFGEDQEKKVITTAFGYGFYYLETPAGFADFLNQHRGTFCTSRKRSQMLLSIIDDGKDPDEVFADFETEKYGSGTGGAVAEILSNETGMYYYHYQDSIPSDGECSSPCIMVGDNEVVKSEVNRSELLMTLHQAAKLLQIPEFGHIYYSYPTFPQVELYDTKTFGYEFKAAD